MEKPTLRDSVKHPEKMGPLGDTPDEPQSKPAANAKPTPIQEEAEIADRQQFATSE
ncbi:MAG TPA: hypothetical protein VK009_20745 [Chloroflexota bacterium]|nr:hypothetical protein [Chloroflexota bacterium]